MEKKEKEEKLDKEGKGHHENKDWRLYNINSHYYITNTLNIKLHKYLNRGEGFW